MTLGCPVGYTIDLTNVSYPHDSDATIFSDGYGDARNISDDDTTSFLQNMRYVSIDYGVNNEKIIRKLRIHVLNATVFAAIQAGFFQASYDNLLWCSLYDFSNLVAPGSYPGWCTDAEFDNTFSYRFYRVGLLSLHINNLFTEWEHMACLPSPYKLKGTVKEQGSGVVRIVRSYFRSTGILYSSTVSEASGAFELDAPDLTTEMFVVAFDDDFGAQYNALIASRVKGILP